jgi:hypothetical protein
MAIQVSAYSSIEHVRNRNLGNRFAQTTLSPKGWPGRPGYIPAIAHSSIDAEVSHDGKRSDCVWRLIKVQIRVMMRIEFNSEKINDSFFDPDSDNPHGYTANAPREADHFRLDEDNVLVHEESHAQDIVDAVQKRIQEELNRPGVEEQLVITHQCEDEQGAYYRLHNLITARISAIGMDAFEALLEDFQRHQTGSATEKKARQAQITEHQHRIAGNG